MAAARLTGAILQGSQSRQEAVLTQTLSSVQFWKSVSQTPSMRHFYSPAMLATGSFTALGRPEVWLLWQSFSWSCWLLTVKWQRAGGHPGLITILCAPRSCPAGLMAGSPPLDPAPLSGLPTSWCLSVSVHCDTQAFCSKPQLGMGEFTSVTGGERCRGKSLQKPSGACLQRCSRRASAGSSLTILMAARCPLPAVPLPMAPRSCARLSP